MKVIKKIKSRYTQFQSHPVTKGEEWKGLYKYIEFNIKNRIFKETIHNWIGNLKFIARKGDAGIVGNIYFGVYEFEESLFLLHLLQKQDTFLDVGANLGHYSLLLSGTKGCRSITIEPVPKTYRQLLKQIQLNHLEELISPFNIGVSNFDGALYFSTDKGTMDRIVSERYRNAVQVPVLSLDSILTEQVPLAMKIDVEGHEKQALEGGQAILNDERLKVLILEINQSGEKYGVSDDEIYTKVLSFGFKPYAYDVANRQLVKLQSYNKAQFNTIFIRDEEFVTNRLKKADLVTIRGRKF
ncbi:FkbM family methyltransferase [Flavobacterium humi]|uniref:FkbM family methyltransferase n=1 Tax=Flavobacterium humi TaxID=2562683 RepID=A0A4Z0L7S0_9FLAO|nr:FkbM family methyltransferase [Flavobacterium humi]TGD57165.1 FkbM family methyltransferase [Flavobacterium humi]